MKTFTCLYCDTTNLCKGHSYTNKYCNADCHNAHKTQKKIQEWKETGKLIKRPVKEYLATLRTGCWECGISSWNDKELVLELDHINGVNTDHREENLRLLCPNCHSQTSTFKGRNKSPSS